MFFNDLQVYPLRGFIPKYLISLCFFLLKRVAIICTLAIMVVMKALIGIISIVTGLGIGGLLLPKDTSHSAFFAGDTFYPATYSIITFKHYVPTILFVVVGFGIGILLLNSDKKKED